MAQFWLAKSEPSVYSIDDLKRDGTTQWTGVRNFKARNYLKAMQPDELVLFYHSNAEPSGVAGVAKVVRAAYPDPTQFDKKDEEAYDPSSRPERPKWYGPDVAFIEKLDRFVALPELKQAPSLQGMLLTSGKASRLSVQPMEQKHFDEILRMGR